MAVKEAKSIELAPPAKRTAVEWEAVRMAIFTEHQTLLDGCPSLLQWRADRWHLEDRRARVLIAEGLVERRAREQAAKEFDAKEDRLVELDQELAESTEPLHRAFRAERDAMFAEAARLQEALDAELRESKEIGKALAVFVALEGNVKAIRNLLIRGMGWSPTREMRQSWIPNPQNFIQSSAIGELVGRVDKLRRGQT